MPRHRDNCTVAALLTFTVSAETTAQARHAARAFARALTNDTDLIDSTNTQFSVSITDAPNQLITLEKVDA